VRCRLLFFSIVSGSSKLQGEVVFILDRAVWVTTFIEIFPVKLFWPLLRFTYTGVQ